MRGLVHRILGHLGQKLEPLDVTKRFPDIPREITDIIKSTQPYTMTTPERLAALCNAVTYVVENNVPGDFVECGVWKGGSSMAAGKMFKTRGKTPPMWLYDTFDGMSEPTAVDKITHSGQSAADLMANSKKQDESPDSVWAYASIDEVRRNLDSIGGLDYRLIRGKVEDTIPHELPAQISILRLDTDFYESTKHELLHLFPLLSRSGVLIIDDYGHWEGARRAVDEYFAQAKIPMLLNRIDNTGRIGIKI